MVTGGSRFLVATLVVSTALFVGCAKRPATTAASAPAPTGTAATTGATGGAARTTPAPPAAAAPPVTAAPQAPTAAARPSPKEFTAIPELKPIYFDFDKYDIRPADAKILDANAQWLKSNDNQRVLIEGHCDERGTAEYNLALGERRAVAAKTYLVLLGIAADKLRVVSYGKEFPFEAGHEEGAWSKNRRAHFVITAK